MSDDVQTLTKIVGYMIEAKEQCHAELESRLTERARTYIEKVFGEIKSIICQLFN